MTRVLILGAGAPTAKRPTSSKSADLDYTIIRPAWLNDRDEVDDGTTRKGEPFENADAVVSRKSVADLVVRLATTPDLHVRESLGVHKPS